MKKILATAGAIAVLALSATPAQAVTPSADAAATAKIYKPLTISNTQGLDFGTIVLVGASFTNEVVTVNTAGPITCGGGANLTCGGTSTPAKFHIVGFGGAAVTVRSPTFNLGGPATLAVTPTVTSQNVTLDATGAADVLLGASITLGSATTQGTYTGTWTVTADYF
jgi:hypothetical protein